MAKKRKRLFNVNYYEFVESVLSDNQSKVNFREINIANILRALLNEPTGGRLKYINYEKVRLQQIYRIEDNIDINKNVWVLKFIRFKDGEIFGVADNKGSYNEDELETLLNKTDDGNQKFIASPTVCLYDEDNNVFAVARNSEGVQPSTIVEYLSAITSKSNLHIRAINKNGSIPKEMILGYRAVDLRIEELRNINHSQKQVIQASAPTVYGAIRSVQKLGIDTFSINGLSDTKNNKLITDNIQVEIAALAAVELDNIKRLKVKANVEGQKKVENIDFLEDKLTDQFSIQIESTNFSKIRYDFRKISTFL